MFLLSFVWMVVSPLVSPHDPFNRLQLVDWRGGLSANPACTEDNSQSKKQGKKRPADPIEGVLSTSGAREHGSTAGCQSTHSVALRAVEQNTHDQKQATGDPDPGEYGGQHGMRRKRMDSFQYP